MSLPYTENIVALNAVTATVANTATGIWDVSKRQLKSIQFTASSITTRSGVFGVEVSNDGVNWIVYSRLTNNVVNGITEGDVRTAAPTMAASTSAIYFFPTSDYFRYIRVFITITDTGTPAGTFTATLEVAG
jgi:hypothetical protein